MVLNLDLTELQIGLETTGGTLVAATHLVPFDEGSFSPGVSFKTLDEVRGINADYDDIITQRGSTLELTQELDFENLIPALECAFANVTPIGSDPYVWTFNPARTSFSPLATATIEIAQTDGANHYRKRFGLARPTAISIEASGETAQLQTTWMGRAAQALTAPAAVAAVSRQIIPASLFKVYIDDTWATLGTTEVGYARSFSAAYVPGLTPAHNLLGRADLDQTGWYRGRIQGTLGLTVDHDGDASAELAHWEAKDLRFIRLQAVVGADLELRFDHCVRYIATPDVLAADGKQHTLELDGQLRADTTAMANRFEVYVKNGVSAW